MEGGREGGREGGGQEESEHLNTTHNTFPIPSSFCIPDHRPGPARHPSSLRPRHDGPALQTTIGRGRPAIDARARTGGGGGKGREGRNCENLMRESRDESNLNKPAGRQGGRMGGATTYLELRRASSGWKLVENDAAPEGLHSILHAPSVLRVAHVDEGETFLP